MVSLMTVPLTVLTAALLLSPAAQAAPVCLEGGTVHLPSGPRATTVVLEDGEVRSLGDSPAGCEVVDVSGKQITAGLIDPHSAIGLVEVSLESATRDGDAGGDAVRAAFSVVDGYNPRSTLIPIARREGITAAVLVPGGGLVSGNAAAAAMAGGTQAEAIQRDAVAMVVNLGARGDGSRAAGFQELRELLDDAAVYANNRAGYERGASRDYAASRLDLEALQPVLRGQLPLLVHLDRASDIEALLRLGDALNLELIIAGGAEAWLHAEALAERSIPVILDPLLTTPRSFDAMYARPDNAALLAEAGVPVMFSAFSAHFARKLRQLAGNAVRAGMDPADALAAITSTPAEVFGLDGMGSVVAGSRADLVVWSGDPLEVTSWAEAVYIAGAPRSMESRQTLLRDRYRTLPGTPAPPLDPALSLE